MSESTIMRSILLALGSRPDLRLWRNNTGVGRTLDCARVVKFGLPGSSDLIGLTNRGIFLAVECKTPAGRQSLQQRRFQKMIEAFGGIYIVARSANDAIAQLRARGYCAARP